MLLLSVPAISKTKEAIDYGAGLIINIPLPQAEVVQVVAETAQNGIIRGTKEYNKDEYVKGAESATSTTVFPAWTEDGKVFYKIRRQALDPRNFKDGNDVGTLAVRYVVQSQDDKNTVLRIDAVFVEDFRHKAHASNGSVESSEYKEIQEHLDAIELMKKETAQAEVERQQRLARTKSGNIESSFGSTQPTGANSGQSSATVADLIQPNALESVGPRPWQSLEEYASELRRQVEKRVKFPGAALKSAPFHSANTMKSLPSGSEVLIVISTPYWFGVETRDGQHGWITRDELEEIQ